GSRHLDGRGGARSRCPLQPFRQSHHRYTSTRSRQLPLSPFSRTLTTVALAVKDMPLKCLRILPKNKKLSKPTVNLLSSEKALRAIGSRNPVSSEKARISS